MIVMCKLLQFIKKNIKYLAFVINTETFYEIFYMFPEEFTVRLLLMSKGRILIHAFEKSEKSQAVLRLRYLN